MVNLIKARMNKIFIFFTLLPAMSMHIHAQDSTVLDIDGNVYKTVVIGTQTWMAENLKTTRYTDKESIPYVPDVKIWDNLTSGAYSFYKNDSSNIETYGLLYNWYAINDNRNVCPAGWYIPGNKEWSELSVFLGGDSVAGGKLKESGTTHWLTPNTGAVNSTGFTALPGGYDDVGSYQLGTGCNFWSASDTLHLVAWYWALWFWRADFNPYIGGKQHGFSIRCIRNSSNQVDEKSNGELIKIFPNPAKDKITILSQAEQNRYLHIYNLFGETVLQKKLISNNEIINISYLPKGLYIIKIKISNETYLRKLIKE